MNWKLLFIVVLALFFSWGTSGDAVQDEPHHFSVSECMDCHVDPDAEPRTLTAPVTMLCGRCHQRVARSPLHPVDVRPQSVTVPESFPLQAGRITCATCHDLHASASLAFGLKSYRLRLVTVAQGAFCDSCHTKGGLSPTSMMLVVAHQPQKFLMTDPNGVIDQLSILCLGCHDGSIGIGVTYITGSGLWVHDSGAHPVGVSYADAMVRGTVLISRTNLDPRLRLYDNRVGCGTCHDMYAQNTSKLVMENHGSRLCRNCHYDK